jgi:Gram-negative bacterial TonB protein C-terminal
MFRRNRSLLGVLPLGIALSVAVRSRAETQPTAMDTAISQLASRIAIPLEKLHATKIVFADLKGPDGQTHPAGRWISDQLANSCKKDFPGLEIMIRPEHEESAAGLAEAGKQKQAFKSVEEWARSVGANVFITGTFARPRDHIGISLQAFSTSDSRISLGEATGLLPVSDAITGLSAEPMPSQKSGVPRAGTAGVSIPQCIYCPPPRYSGDARKAKVEGTVVLQVVVTSDGRATNIVIVKRSRQRAGHASS